MQVRETIGGARAGVSAGRALAVVVALVAFLSAACLPEFRGPADAMRIVVLGDSIVEMSTDAVFGALGPAHRVAVNGEAGATSTRVRALAARHLPGDAAGGAVVVNAGANDWLKGVDLDTTFANLADIRDRFEGERCFVVATMSTSTGVPALNDWAAGFNARLVTDAPGWVAMDWDSVVEPDLTTDSLHPNERGRQRYAELVLETVEQGC